MQEEVPLFRNSFTEGFSNTLRRRHVRESLAQVHWFILHSQLTELHPRIMNEIPPISSLHLTNSLASEML